jgi:hypothetical protein
MSVGCLSNRAICLLWARLAVFAGSFDTEAVEQVCAGEPLERENLLASLIGLVDKSVVLRADGDGTRYLLLETIREFGAEKLTADSAEQAELRGRHIARHLALATALADEPTAENQLPRYRRLWTEEANLRAALDYALAAPGRQRDAARLANALSVYWQMASSPGEGRFWLGRVLPLFWGPSRERALALINVGYLASLQGETDDGIASLEKDSPSPGSSRTRAPAPAATCTSAPRSPSQAAITRRRWPASGPTNMP